LELDELRQWADAHRGVVVKVVFRDPYWWRVRQPEPRPLLEVVGRVHDVDGDGLAVRALGLASGDIAAIEPEDEGQFIYWELIDEVCPFDEGPPVYRRAAP
jgi:hypothetical protein